MDENNRQEVEADWPAGSRGRNTEGKVCELGALHLPLEMGAEESLVIRLPLKPPLIGWKYFFGYAISLSVEMNVWGRRGGEGGPVK